METREARDQIKALLEAKAFLNSLYGRFALIGRIPALPDKSLYSDTDSIRIRKE